MSTKHLVRESCSRLGGPAGRVTLNLSTKSNQLLPHPCPHFPVHTLTPAVIIRYESSSSRCTEFIRVEVSQQWKQIAYIERHVKYKSHLIRLWWIALQKIELYLGLITNAGRVGESLSVRRLRPLLRLFRLICDVGCAVGHRTPLKSSLTLPPSTRRHVTLMTLLPCRFQPYLEIK
jgi:hypothetical protein